MTSIASFFKNPGKVFHRIISILLVVTGGFAVTYRFFEAASWVDRLDVLGYFTIQSNMLVIILVFLQLIRLTIKPRLKLAAGSAICITALIFQVFLKQGSDMQGFSVFIGDINHGSTTVLYLLWMWSDKDRGNIRFKDLWTVLPYPVAYCVFGILEAYNTAPPARYFFLDVPAMGWGKFSIWLVCLAALFLLTGFLITLFYKQPVKTAETQT